MGRRGRSAGPPRRNWAACIRTACIRPARIRTVMPVPVEAVFIMRSYFKEVSASVNAVVNAAVNATFLQPGLTKPRHCARARFVEHRGSRTFPP